MAPHENDHGGDHGHGQHADGRLQAFVLLLGQARRDRLQPDHERRQHARLRRLG